MMATGDGMTLLIGTNSLRGMAEATVDGFPITDRWKDLAALLAQRCGPDVASLFAEPVISRTAGGGDATARWYTDADGPVIGYMAVDDEGRREVGEAIKHLLVRMAPLLADPASSKLVGPCLHVSSMYDIKVVGDRPVIVNWGFLPEQVAVSAVAREAHFRAGLGQFWPEMVAPPFETALPVRLLAEPSPAAVASAAVVPPAVTTVSETGVAGRPWLPVAIATGVALVVLLVLLFGNVLRYPEPSTTLTADADVRREITGTLQEQVRQLRLQLETMTCSAANPTGQPLAPGATLPPAGPAAPSAPGLPGPATPGRPAPSQGEVPRPPAEPVGKAAATEPPRAPPTAGNTLRGPGGAPPGALSADQLWRVEEKTVLVIAVISRSNSISTGTAFFINERQLVTNRHVVSEMAPQDKLFVVNRALHRPQPARVVAMAEPNTPDLAVLEVDSPVAQPALAISTDVRKLQPVIAAGFTGGLISLDEGYRRLMSGDASAMPEMITTQGVVTVVQGIGTPAPVVFHSATVSNGNSGGPLVDTCGRVVAVNTFVRLDSRQPIVFNGAIGSAAITYFLESNRVPFAKATDACGEAAPPRSP